MTAKTSKCTVPMWRNGTPDGQCGLAAYGKRPYCKTWIEPRTGQEHRLDGRYAGYAPGLVCHRHGGPKKSDVAHSGDPCVFCGTPHDEVMPGPCAERQKQYL